MLISRETDYGIRIMRNLKEDEVTSIASIIDKEDMTLAIGYKVARKLEKAGLIKSTRGHTGGYSLAKRLDEICLADVYVAIEPFFAINQCLREDRPCPLNEGDNSCRVHCELQRIQEVVLGEFTKKSLAQILAGE